MRSLELATAKDSKPLPCTVITLIFPGHPVSYDANNSLVAMLRILTAPPPDRTRSPDAFTAIESHTKSRSNRSSATLVGRPIERETTVEPSDTQHLDTLGSIAAAQNLASGIEVNITV